MLNYIVSRNKSTYNDEKYENIFLLGLATIYLWASTKNNHLQIKLNNRNQVDEKIAWGLGEGVFIMPSPA